MKKLLLALLLMLSLASPVFAAGTCTITNVTSTQNASAKIPDSYTVIVTMLCTADASDGTYPSTPIPMTGSSSTLQNVYNLFGYYLYQVGRTPGATAPTGNYTVTITDVRGFALDLGLLTSNGSASAAQLTLISNSTTGFPVIRSIPTVAITGNVVNSAVITLDFIFKAQ